jgi:hypothetical protein
MRKAHGFAATTLEARSNPKNGLFFVVNGCVRKLFPLRGGSV